MQSLKLVIAAALLVAPTAGMTQKESVKLGQKAKAWMTANFGSFDCALASGPGAALTGGGPVSFDASGTGGIELSVAAGDGGSPTIMAHAINTKGTGATNGRMAPQACATAEPAPDGAAACTVSGDAEAPSVRFTLPLAALGDAATARNYVGTVTIVKRASSGTLTGMTLSKKGYDYYQAQNNRSVAAAGASPAWLLLATCDSSKLVAKGDKPKIATYDLAVSKK